MTFIRKLLWMVQRKRREAELREELEFHIDEEAEELQSDGLTRQEARWSAHRELGNVTLVQERVRGVWIWTFWERLLQDLRYAWRMMMASKTFTALAVLSLALGIGANTALFSFMDSILLRALPVSDPDSLVILEWHSPPRWIGNEKQPSVVHGMSGTIYGDEKDGNTAGIFPYPAFELFRRNEQLFSSVFAYHAGHSVDALAKGQADVVREEYVSGDYFGGLGVPPLAGRMIDASDDDAGSPPAAVISARFSDRHFARPTDAVGQTILVNNAPWTVIGVTPAQFTGVDPSFVPDVYLPMHSSVVVEGANPFGDRPERFFAKNDYWIEVMARLRPGVTREQAQVALGPQFDHWVRSTVTANSELERLPALLVQKGSGGVESLRREYSQPLGLLIALAGLILAIACANIANLLLARGTARRSEMALRLSLGAGRLRLVRQLLTESVLLASLGGAFGVLVAVWGMRFLAALLALGQEDFPLHPSLNWRVLGVAIALSLMTGLLFGLAPALAATRVNLLPSLKTNRAGDTGSRSRPGLSRVLVVSQIALSLLMLVAAGLFARTLANLQSVQLGFNRDNVLLFQLDARKAGHTDPEISAFYGDLLTRFRAIPGVVQATVSSESLVRAGSGLDIYLPGAPPDETTRYLTIGPGYFKTMQIPILAGREIDDQDHAGATPVAVVSELFARKNFGNQSPLGRHIILENEGKRREMEIVGVARNAHYGPPQRKLRPVVYFAYDQGYPPPREMTYEMRTAGDPLAHVNAVRRIVQQADARVPVTEVRTQVADIDDTMTLEITLAKLCTGFAVLALVIAFVGLYGTVSYNAARRTVEIGIRMALGAQRGDVIWMVLREVVILAMVGLAVSVPVALIAARLIRTFLFGMKPNDPLAIISAVLILVSAALLAGYLPARRASHIDPMIALRHE